RELRAQRGIAAAEDLILVELDHAAVIAELEEQRRELVHHVLIGRRQIVQLLEIDRGALRIREDVAPQARAPLEELADERAVEDLLERAGQRRLDAREHADLAAERLERLERGVVDVRDERVAEPAEGLVHVAQIAERDRRRAPEQRAAGAAAVARSLPAGRERLGQDRAERDAAAAIVPDARRALEHRDRVLL